MGKQQQQLSPRHARSSSISAIFPCVCMLLGVLVIMFQAGPLSLMWTDNLRSSGLPIFGINTSYAEIASEGGNTDDNRFGWSAFTRNPGPAVLEIEAPPCTCFLRVSSFLGLDAVFPGKELANCSCPENTTMSLQSSAAGCDQQQAAPPCPPAAQPQKPIIRYEEPWYAKGRSWHMPARFPRCTMDACFNYSRCDSGQELLIFAYNVPAQPSKFFAKLNETRHYTDNPEKACLFLVFLDTPGLYRSNIHPRELPYWHGGLNHVLITFGDKWRNKAPIPESVGYASAMATVMHETLYRPGFDVSIPLPAKRHFSNLRHLGPFQRKYLMTFRGLRYLENDGTLRSSSDFRGMHNGADIVVVTSCRHVGNGRVRKENATIDEECKRDEAIHKSYKFDDLMNSTFGLAPAGRQPSSYRFAEILSAGGVPVLVVDNYVKPFETLIQWHRCALQFPSSEMHRIVKTIRAMKPAEVKRRQRYCLHVYERWFSSDEALLQASIASQKTRFMGAFPSWEPPLID